MKVDIVTSDDIKIYYTGKFQDFTARYIIKQVSTHIQYFFSFSLLFSFITLKVRSANSHGPFRNPNPPTVYFPPIGVRLVRKYVGVDIKTGEKFDPSNPGNGVQKSKGDSSSSNLSKSFRELMAPDVVKSAIRRMSKIDENDVTALDTSNPLKESGGTRHASFKRTERYEQRRPLDTSMTPIDECEEVTKISELPVISVKQSLFSNESNVSGRTRTLPVHHDTNSFTTKTDINVDKKTLALRREMHAFLKEPDIDESLDNDNIDNVFIETTYNLKDRRSSRSTFRTRSTVRLVSQSTLSEHNMEVINQPRRTRGRSETANSKTKQDVGQFYLDYGDGKLHDNMKIPNIKDCARPWCNPHCHTCQRRTKKGPCFVLIPKGENDRKRQVPTDKRRLSMFPIYRRNSDLSTGSSTDSLDNQTVNGENQPLKNKKSQDNKLEEKNDDPTSNENDTQTALNKDIETLLKKRMQNRKRGYSKKRIDELAKPRGVPPAEVRFSKTSLRRKQEQMKEGERHKAMELEKRNQTIIQGKIGMFLALLNEQESVRKPIKIVDIPIREDVKLKRKKLSRKKFRRQKFIRSERFQARTEPGRGIL